MKNKNEKEEKKKLNIWQLPAYAGTCANAIYRAYISCILVVTMLTFVKTWDAEHNKLSEITYSI